MTRRGKLLLFLPATLLLMLSLTMAWLLRTPGGAGFLLRQADSRIDAELQVARISGSLTSGLSLQNLSYRDASVLVTAPDISLQLDIDVFPPALHLERLDSSAIAVQLFEPAAAEPEQSLADTLSALQLPYPVRFDAVTIGELQILGSDQSELFSARNIATQARWHRQLEITRARLLALEGSWQFAGRLQLQQPFAAKGTVSLESELRLDATNRMPLQLQADFDGNLDRLETRLRSVQPGFTLEGELLDLLNQPGWELELQANALDWPPGPAGSADDPAPLLTLRDTSLSTQGSVSAYEVQLATQISSELFPGGDVELSGHGDLDGLAFDHLRMDGAELQLAATGGLDWQQEFLLSLQTSIENLRPQRWLADWPQDHPIQGHGQLGVSSTQLQFSDLSLTFAGADTSLSATGSYRFDSEELDGNVSWQSLAWPPGASNPEMTSQSGQLSLQGAVNAWQADGDLQLQFADLPPGRLQLEAAGNAEGVQLHIPRGQVLGGEFAGEVDYRWAEPQRWSADITADGISTTPLAPEFPGVLSGTVLAQGEAGSPQLQFELQDVRGRIRGQDLSAQGRFALQGSALQADGLQLRSGSAQLTLDGGLGAGQTLAFSAKAEELSQLWPGWSGRLQASGRVSLDAKSPRLEIDLEADELQMGEQFIGQVRTLQQTDGSTSILVRDGNLAGREVPELELRLDASHQLQNLQLTGVMDGTRVESSLAGRLQSTDGKRINGWQGRIDSLRLSQPERGQLQLVEPTPLLLSSARMELAPGCLRGSRDGLICLQGHWTEQGDAGIKAGLQQVSLDIVRLFVDMDWAFTHRLDGGLEWRRSKGQTAAAQAHFSLTPGELLFEDEATNFSTGPGTFEFEISEGNLHSGTLNIPIVGSGEVDMDFAVTRLLDGGAAQLQANLKLQLRDLTPLQLLPYVDVVKGEISADLRISGSLENPQFTGHAVLVRGYVENQASGLVLSEIQLAGAVYQYDHTELNGSFRAGEGRGRIKADLQFEDFLNPEFSVQLSGENLRLVDVPDMKLLALM